jgi:PhzF family phenazine biosynthesis protein
MSEHPFRIVNVFTRDGQPLSGNPLCVFEDGAGLDSDRMQALARQFNLSETTFVMPPTTPAATARVRIFTPSFEMPFAGHPTLGTAHVVRDVCGAADRVVLEMGAGLVEVQATGGAGATRWTLRAVQPPAVRVPDASPHDLAQMLNLPDDAIGAQPLWIDTGAEQLVVPLTSVDAVRRARPRDDLLSVFGWSERRRASMVYVWAPTSEGPASDVVARFFFSRYGVAEDPATGSACANLGGWMIATGRTLPVGVDVRQGDAVDRPSRLRLDVDAERSIRVGGDVLEIGRGRVSL